MWGLKDLECFGPVGNELSSVQKAALALFKAGLTGNACTLPADPDWSQIHQIALDQGMMCVVYNAIKSSGISVPSEILRTFQAESLATIRSDRLQINEINALFGEFEAKEIDYLPLKGIDYKALYPKPEYRWMADADIYFRKEQYQEISKILEARGFVFDCESDHEYIWEKPGVLKLELHKVMTDPSYQIYISRFKDGFEMAERVGNTHRYRFGATDQLVYATAHFTKHYMSICPNVRNLLDMYYLSKDPKVDQKKLDEMLDGLRLKKLYSYAVKAVDCWLNDRPFDENCLMILNRTLTNSAEFNEKRKYFFIAASMNKGGSELSSKSKSKTLIYRLFPPVLIMKYKYPVLRKAPVLLPFCWIHRAFEGVFFKHKLVNVFMKEYKESPDQVRAYVEEMEKLGLEEWVERVDLR